MPCTLTWEPKGLLRTFHANRDLTGEDIFESNLKTHKDARFKDIEYIINDFTKVTCHSVRITHTEVYASTDQMIANTKHTLKIALIASDESILDLARNYCALMQEQSFECKIFPNVEAARNWVCKKPL